MFLAFDIEEPAREGAVHDALFASRIEGVFVLDVFNFINNTGGFEAFGDKFVAGPDLDAVFVGVSDAKGVELVGVFLDIITIFI